MTNSEKSAEGFIEDNAAAWKAARAEKPARDFSHEHKDELTPEQRQALDWFASSEGEKALVDYQQQKDKHRGILWEMGLSLLDLKDLPDKDINRLDYLNRQEFPDSKSFVARVDEVLKHNKEQQADRVLSDDRLTLADKMTKFQEFGRYLKGDLEWYSQNFRRDLADGFGFKESLLVIALVDKNFDYICNELAKLKGKEFDDVVNRYASYVDAGNNNTTLNKLMLDRNYIVNPSSNSYEKVE